MSTFKDFLTGTASRAAAAIAGLKPKSAKAEPKFMVTHKAGKPGAPFRRIIAHVPLPARTVIAGVRYSESGEQRLMVKTVVEHMFLHATKGWRNYSGGGLPGFGRSSTPSFARNPVRTDKYHKMMGNGGWRPAHIVDGHLKFIEA